MIFDRIFSTGSPESILLFIDPVLCASGHGRSDIAGAVGTAKGDFSDQVKLKE